jgi:hypothetical protein
MIVLWVNNGTPLTWPICKSLCGFWQCFSLETENRRCCMFLPFLGARFGSCPAQQSPRPRVGRAGVRRLDLCTWELESLPKRAMDQEMLIPSYSWTQMLWPWHNYNVTKDDG